MIKQYILGFYKSIPAIAMIIIALNSCRTDEPVLQPTKTPVTNEIDSSSVLGFYLLNEGNMGSNKATLDYFDFSTGIYTKNIYAVTNPQVVSELGDVGNDIQIYGNKLYAVINASGFVEVMDAKTAKHIANIEIPNCRYITFNNGRAYVSSYTGPVEMDNEYAQKGYVAEIDTTNFEITRTVTVGYQPEEMAISNGELFVANSGGYMAPYYDNTVSVIDLNTFTETEKIEIGINLHRVKADKNGNIYISSRGDYMDVASCLYIVNTQTKSVVKKINIPVSNFCIMGDSAYVLSSEYSFVESTVISYSIIDTNTQTKVSSNFITDGTEKNIKMPYGIAVHPATRDIYISDAKTYIIPGTLYCYSKTGKRKWYVTTGDIPAHMTFFINHND